MPQAPDRFELVKQIWNEHPPSSRFTTEELRRDYLLQVLIPVLNEEETLGEWGCLVKTEQGNKIPSDIVVWKATMEHFDVLIGTEVSGPAWQAHGVVTNSNWKFGPVADLTPGDDGNDDTAGDDVNDPENELSALRFEIDDLNTKIEQNRIRMEAINTRFDNELKNVYHKHEMPEYTGKLFGFTMTSMVKI